MRLIKIRVLALCAMALLACGWAGAADVAPPPTEPNTETLFGRTIDDEYRWMEDPARAADVKSWVLAESAVSVEQLARMPMHPVFAAALKAASGKLSRVFTVALANDRLLAFQRIEDGDRVAKLVLRSGTRERVLIDPNASAAESVQAVNNHSLSPDGRYVAVHTAAGGAEVGQIVIHDLASGRTVGDPIGPVWGEFSLTWIGNDTVVYTLMAPPGRFDDQSQGMTAYVRRLDGRGAPLALLGPDTRPTAVVPKDFPLVSASRLSPWVVAMGAGARADVDLWVLRRDAIRSQPTPWRRVASLAQRVNGFALLGERLYLLATAANPYGQVTRQGLDNTRDDRASVLFEGRDDLILEGLSATQDGLYLTAITEGRGRLFYSAKGTTPFREVQLPFEGSIVNMEASSDGRWLSFGLTGWLTNTSYYTVRQGRLAPLGLASDTWAGVSAFAVKRLQATSRDGTKVPLVVLHPRTAAPDGGYPALLRGYGSYGNSSAVPRYDRFAMAWLQQGGVIANCGTRGGGERGRAWHDGGRERNKPNAHDDLVACATVLKHEGLARSVGPVVMGTSAGGLLAPPAALKRPDAFAGLVARVAVTNPTRLAAAPNGANQFDEMGNPGTAEGWAALASQDAYLMSATAADMPDTLLTIGLNDKRVAPWMSAKLAARAKTRFGSRRTILLRADSDAGHGVGSAEAVRQAEMADIFAFAWSRASR